MRIVCPNCGTSYDVTADALGGAGRAVRCARCRETWFAAAAAPAPAFQMVWGDDLGAREAEPAFPADTSIEAFAAASRDAMVDAREDAAADISEGLSGEEAAGQEAAPEAPPLVPALDATVPTPATTSLQADIETVAARRAHAVPAPVGRRRRLRPSAPWVILGLTGVVAALIAWRTQVVRVAPQTASFYARIGLPVNLRGLAFNAVTTREETREGVPVLVIDGAIANVTRSAVEVPRLRFALRNPQGVEVYAWTALPTASVLPAGEELPFRTRLASPPADARDVQVRFFNRQDREAAR